MPVQDLGRSAGFCRCGPGPVDEIRPVERAAIDSGVLQVELFAGHRPDAGGSLGGGVCAMEPWQRAPLRGPELAVIPAGKSGATC